MIEIVSPSTVSIDRAIKPAMYAEAAIPVYWRVELQDTPKIVVSSLSRGRYVTRTTLTAGTKGRITRPFAVELTQPTSPAALAEATWVPAAGQRFVLGVALRLVTLHQYAIGELAVGTSRVLGQLRLDLGHEPTRPHSPGQYQQSRHRLGYGEDLAWTG